MCGFLKKIGTFNTFDHNGCERELQKAILLKLRGDGKIVEFSTDHTEINNKCINKRGYGLELGCTIDFKNGNGEKSFFVDIALAKHDGSNPTEIINLCEVKIIDPKEYPFKGRWYKYIYKNNYTPPSFDCLQNLYPPEKFKNIVTDADEGQIVFDLIKMLAFCEKLDKKSDLYQIIAVKKVKGVQDFNTLKEKIISFLDSWKIHIGANQNNLSIYKWEDFVTKNYGAQTFAIQCKKPQVLNCTITDLGEHDGYIHVLLNWQPGNTADFTF